MGMRRKGRELAVQTIYSLDFSDTDEYLGMMEWIGKYSEYLDYIAENSSIVQDSTIYTFADDLVQKVIRNIDAVDSAIKDKAVNWSFERIAAMDKNIMRIAVAEILFTDTPSPIIINEAIEIAKKFSSENSGKFINGILNTIAKENEEPQEENNV